MLTRNQTGTSEDPRMLPDAISEETIATAQLKATLSLGTSARRALVWGAGFNIIRDLLQFVGTIVLVRLLTPYDYGRAALALTVFSLVSAVSFKSVILHALQIRNPADIDWQSHFTGGFMINVAMGAALIGVGAILAEIPTYAAAAPLVCALAAAMLLDLLGNLRFMMVQTQHNWARFRLLLLSGALLAMVVSIGAAWLGAGAWSLLAGTVLLNVPAAIDLLVVARWRPTFERPSSDYRRCITFGLNRAVSTLVLIGRQAAEQSAIVTLASFAALGIFTRSFGLSTMVAGRVGLIATQTLYPVLTRTDPATDKFRRAAGLLLAGASWITIPAALFLACNSRDLVFLLYGAKWAGVSDLLPLVSAVVAVTGLTQCASQLLLANERAKQCLQLDCAGAVVALILVATVMPRGIELYLASYAILAVALLAVTLSALRRSDGISGAALAFSFAPPAICAIVASGAVFATDHLGVTRFSFTWEGALWEILAHATVFGAVFTIALRLGFPNALRTLLSTLPSGKRFASLLHLRRVASGWH